MNKRSWFGTLERVRNNIPSLTKGDYWIVIFLLIPVLIGLGVIRISFAKIYSVGLFPNGTSTPESVESAPFLEKITNVWLGGVIGPTGERVCITNRNKVYVNGIEAALPYSQDPEVGAMEIDVNFSDYTHQQLVYVPANGSACGSFTLKQGVPFASTTLIYRYPQNIPVMLGRTSTGQMQGVATLGIDPGNSSYEIHLLWSDVVITFLKVLAAWWLVVIAVAESIEVSIKLSNGWRSEKNRSNVSK
ncbi:MAG TPA: hypothetical protein VM103_02895 [Candidatus Paceibacterota bacterium]|nr:hypothetical protein [Candidatus Paceibacterota bacterium]